MAESPLRFVVSVDADWQVTVSCPTQGLALPSRAMRTLPDGRGGAFPLAPAAELLEPAPGAPLPACCRLYCRTEDPAVLTEGREQITQRRLKRQVGTSPFGGYLFHALIGAAAWRWIREIAAGQRARCIELALSWAHREANLNRLNWEMMHDGQAFLATGLPGMTVAITRLVAETTGGDWEPRQIKFPPRILFVVGTTLNDPSLRPAAEFLGLLRELEDSRRRIRTRVLEQASPRELDRVIRAFQPDVVHFICHGDLDPESRRGFLELTPDGEDGEAHLFADQLSAAMKAAAPPLVVLSACRSGSTEVGRATPPQALEGAHDLAPLATELVRQGIPMVLGMAGRVSDTVCRLFTRQFGAALVRGESLVVATAEARRATVLEGASAEESVDWAFPALFAAEQVTPGYVPVQGGAADRQTPAEAWIEDYDLNPDLVFCGRNDFFSAYYGFFSPNNPRRVLAVVTDGQAGVGRTRLLFELSAQMLRDGHVPVILASKSQNWKPPQSLQGFRGILVEKIREVRGILELGSAPDSQLRLLGQALAEAGAGVSLLHDDIREDLGLDGELTPAALSRALQFDLRRLVKDARARHESIGGANGRAVIVLDQMEDYGSQLNGQIYEMLGHNGFGTRDEPVPAVLAVAMGGVTNTFVKDDLERTATKSWVRQLPLKPFDPESEEDLLAYSWFLLNPPQNFDIGRHYLDYKVPGTVKLARNWMRREFAGLPGRFANRDKFVGFTKEIEESFAFSMPSDADDRKALTQALKWADREGSR